jgi:hypothetical protein
VKNHSVVQRYNTPLHHLQISSKTSKAPPQSHKCFRILKIQPSWHPKTLNFVSLIISNSLDIFENI